MAASGSPGLREANTPLGSQFNDDDIINNQIQADLKSQAELYRTDLPKRARKRISRDVDKAFSSNADESPRKKRKERDRDKEKEKEDSEGSSENGLDASKDFSSNGADPLPKLSNGTTQTGKSFSRAADASSKDFNEPRSIEANKEGKKKEVKDKTKRDSSLAVVAGRTSLGSNREALLQSILKGCSPEKIMDDKVEHILASESESDDASTAPKVSSTLKTSSNARPRHRVSMVPVLPEGYKPGLSGSKARFHCPVEGCDKLYTRKTTLGEHMNTLHRGQRLRDNKDGTMNVISLEDYKLAISNGSNQTIVEIPDTPFPSKPIKAARSRPNGGKEKKIHLTSEASREGSVVSDEKDPGRSKAAKTGRESSNAKNIPATGKQKASKVSRLERRSSENGTSGEDDSSTNGDRSRQSIHSAIKSPKSKSVKRKSSMGLPVEAFTNEATMLSKSTGSHLSTIKGTHQNRSEDEMEDWEIDPGVIAGSSSDSDDDSETEHNTAYSSVYTTSAEAGIKFSGVHFQVIRLAPGLIAPGQDVPYLRVCSVASGKVQIQVGDNQFSIGAHGMWRIRPGEKCTLANRHYSEAVIHVSTIKAD